MDPQQNAMCDGAIKANEFFFMVNSISNIILKAAYFQILTACTLVPRQSARFTLYMRGFEEGSMHF